MTDGARRLVKWMKVNGSSQEALAERLKMTQASVSRIVTGTGRPSPATRAAIRIITGIEEEVWLTAEERQRLRRVSGGEAA